MDKSFYIFTLLLVVASSILTWSILISHKNTKSGGDNKGLFVLVTIITAGYIFGGIFLLVNIF